MEGYDGDLHTRAYGMIQMSGGHSVADATPVSRGGCREVACARVRRSSTSGMVEKREKRAEARGVRCNPE